MTKKNIYDDKFKELSWTIFICGFVAQIFFIFMFYFEGQIDISYVLDHSLLMVVLFIIFIDQVKTNVSVVYLNYKKDYRYFYHLSFLLTYLTSLLSFKFIIEYEVNDKHMNFIIVLSVLKIIFAIYVKYK